MIDVMLVAPVRAYREALVELIGSDREMAVVAHSASAAEALACIAPKVPSVTVLDFSMAHFLPALAALKHTTPATPVLAFAVPAGGADAETVVRAAETGVIGFIDTDQPLSDVVAAIRLSVRGESPCSPRIASMLLTALRRRPGLGGPARAVPETSPGGAGEAHPLTPREVLVAQLVAHGMSNRQIAGELVVGEATVKSHVHAVLRKLGVRRREQITLADILDSPRTRAPHSSAFGGPRPE